jgi:hypothetical protein
MTIADTTFRATLRGFLARLDEADQAALAATCGSQEERDLARQRLLGELWALGHDCADLFLMLLREALQHHPETLRGLLWDLLASEFGRVLGKKRPRGEDRHG